MKKNIITVILMLIVFSIGFSKSKTKQPKVKLTSIEKKAAKELRKEEKKTAKAQKKIDTKDRKADESFRKRMKKYELEAVIKTNKGEISVFLYPEAAPVNVANFVYLAKNNFYNGLKFHRIIQSVLVQTGDPEGNGMGNTGYVMDDELINWLNFENAGVLAMANTGPNTNSSQFFITITSLPQLNNKYTIIGETKSREDLSVVRILRQEDTVTDIEIRGKKVDEFLGNFSNEIAQWDEVLKNRK